MVDQPLLDKTEGNLNNISKFKVTSKEKSSFLQIDYIRRARAILFVVLFEKVIIPFVLEHLNHFHGILQNFDNVHIHG